MTSIAGLGFKGGGIVAVLIVAGILLNATKIDPSTGSLAIFAGVVIGIALGGLGIVGVLKRLL